ncbi:MAG: hypothetical protein KC643_13675 [Nitrospira sp.]|nr:hypothetical protein [Nitrospira sp.]
METVFISKRISQRHFFDQPGFNEGASAELFIAYLKEAWQHRAKRDWPGAYVVIHLTLIDTQVCDTSLEIWGENAAGDTEDLYWQIPEYEGDTLRLCEQFHTWAVPMTED